jgi:hypothetical protein
MAHSSHVNGPLHQRKSDDLRLARMYATYAARLRAGLLQRVDGTPLGFEGRTQPHRG